MSRTYRNVSHSNPNARAISYRSSRIANLRAYEELIEEGYKPSNRHTRMSSYSYLNNRDDLDVAGWHETDHIWKRARSHMKEQYGYLKGWKKCWTSDGYYYYEVDQQVWDRHMLEYWHSKFEAQEKRKLKRRRSR